MAVCGMSVEIRYVFSMASSVVEVKVMMGRMHLNFSGTLFADCALDEVACEHHFAHETSATYASHILML